ncbi:hypothetical protein BKP35_06520 [Anaerobacillus arseniciselenatis]|uniref:TVP38/TMEM64 family membrane protein n=1 Tax=Anaerobacillus arseniciselenatis TaxID=85682 RepID=A0A1S2LQ09_9BACI|nr:VTT domain-containing protein [Anaerobacillus arseniciselenatis]OIJ14561.1 hypothetical protein BKP35_06520 [Anaerobacillus arseniciselenatis]
MNPWVKIALFGFLITISIVVVQRLDIFTLVMNGDLDAIRLLLNENIVYILFITLMMMILQNTFTIIPLIILITLNIMLFGFFYGVIWSWVTSIIGGVSVFIATRYFFQDVLLRRINVALKEKVEENGFLFVFIGRIFPFVPTSLINIVSGVSSIKLKHFFIATTVGNLIYFFMLGLIPMGIVTLEMDYYILGILSVIIIGAYYFYKYYLKNKSLSELLR